MDILTVFLIGVGLAMDAFAVSLCKGLAFGKVRPGQALIVGIWFGVFQAVMPIIGFLLGRSFYDLVSSYAYWIAFLMLAVIGVNMIREALFGVEEGIDDSLGFAVMLFLAVATSIDALAVGISLAMEGGDILLPSAVIGIVTLLISMAGVYIGGVFGDRFGRNAEILGGVILIGIGTKFLLTGLGLL